MTVAQYKDFCQASGHQMPQAPDWGWNDGHPMIDVSYDDATAYCNWLSGEYGGHCCLPTEAEWEYAARGGKKSKGFKYSGSNDLDEVAWYDDNCGDQIEPAGRKRSNELGLYDMSGNAWEWCLDWIDAYSESPQTNPKGHPEGQFRVVRGGSCFNADHYCHVTYRYYNVPFEHNSDFGFRILSDP